MNYEKRLFLECFVSVFARQYLAFGQGRELKKFSRENVIINHANSKVR